MSTLTDSAPWQALIEHQAHLSEQSIRGLFAENPQRFSQFSLEVGDLLLDYSKNLYDAQTLNLLDALATKTQLAKAIDAMFAGERINTTEDHPALHVALRSPDRG